MVASQLSPAPHLEAVNLPIQPPLEPMLAKSVADLPAGDDFVYEPKWDGFRGMVFRDGDTVSIESRNQRPLTRYFPELPGPLRSALPEQCVVDGEVVIAGAGGLDFDGLLQRIHPAASRIQRLAEETPASFVAFDLLALDQDLRSLPFFERRSLLEASLRPNPRVRLTPATDSLETARRWFERFEGAGLDGIVAKHKALPYQSGQRVMLKIKHQRTADCVVGGFRWHARGHVVGSLLLGLFDTVGVLHHVGVTSSFTSAERQELVSVLEPYRSRPGLSHPWLGAPGGDAEGRRPGAQSRWSAGRDLSFEPLRPELVCEVAYDHLQGDRFRHGTTFKRWRPDRRPAGCRYDQLEAAVPPELAELFPTISSPD